MIAIAKLTLVLDTAPAPSPSSLSAVFRSERKRPHAKPGLTQRRACTSLRHCTVEYVRPFASIVVASVLLSPGSALPANPCFCSAVGGGGGYSNGYANGHSAAPVAASGDNGVGQFGVVQPAAQNYRQTSAEYRAEHGLQLQGDPPVPEPYQTFESVGFPHDILDEVPHMSSRRAAGRRAAFAGAPWRLLPPVWA